MPPPARPPAPCQAYEPNYRWDPLYRLDRREVSKPSGLAVAHTLKRFAADHSIDRFTRFSTEVLTVRQQEDGRWGWRRGG